MCLSCRGTHTCLLPKRTIDPVAVVIKASDAAVAGRTVLGALRAHYLIGSVGCRCEPRRASVDTLKHCSTPHLTCRAHWVAATGGRDDAVLSLPCVKTRHRRSVTQTRLHEAPLLSRFEAFAWRYLITHQTLALVAARQHRCGGAEWGAGQGARVGDMEAVVGPHGEGGSRVQEEQH